MADTTPPATPPPTYSLFPDLDLELPSPSPPGLLFTVPRLRRGPLYSAYSELRESKLRRKKEEDRSPVAPATRTPQTPERNAAAGATARSISDSSAAPSKENRTPVASWGSPAPPKASALARTPPRPPPATVAASSKSGGAVKRAGGAARGERGGGGQGVRKSYSCLRELKGLTSPETEEEGRAPGGGKAVAVKLARRYY